MKILSVILLVAVFMFSCEKNLTGIPDYKINECVVRGEITMVNHFYEGVQYQFKVTKVLFFGEECPTIEVGKRFLFLDGSYNKGDLELFLIKYDGWDERHDVPFFLVNVYSR